LAHEKLNEIKDFKALSGPTMTIDFATNKCPGSIDDGNFRDGWGAPSNAIKCKKIADWSR